MADNTTSTADLRGRCPPPFYDAAQFGFGGCTYFNPPILKQSLMKQSSMAGSVRLWEALASCAVCLVP